MRKVKCSACGREVELNILNKLVEYIDFWGEGKETYKCECGHLIIVNKLNEEEKGI